MSADTPIPSAAPGRKIAWLVWAGLVTVTTAFLLVILVASLKFRSAVEKPLPVIASVADFTLTNQSNQRVTLEDLKGKVWVGDIIFTRCAGPCPRMTQQMRSLQKALPAESSAVFVTLTTDPKFDTPEVLRQYAKRFEADLSNWIFLTGDPAEIGRLATDSLKLSAVEVDPAERTDPANLFIHSTYFVLVDTKGHLRAVFDSADETTTSEAFNRRLLRAVRQLEKEK